MQTPLSPQPRLAQLLDLTLIQLSNWRWSWRSLVISSIVTPLLGIIALGVFARDSGAQALGYILTGNLVMALVFGTLSKVANTFAYIRARGMLHYFATLPIQSSSLVLATTVAFFLLSLPSTLVTLAIGALYLKIQVRPNLLLLLVLPLAASSLSGIGAVIGVRARDPEEANAISTLMALGLIGIGPVLAPPERLPDFLVWMGVFSPATYAASALRQTLIGPLTNRIWIDLAVLAIFSLATLWWVGRNMNWRQSAS
jgi:ABC-2 type transport system permease protein